jgi:predicted RNA methylase
LSGKSLNHQTEENWRLSILGRLRLKTEELYWERRLGIETSGDHSGPLTTDEHVFYSTCPFRAIFRILESLELGPSDTLLDLGCGKGRVLCCASLYNLKQVIGIDDDEALTVVARQNIARTRGWKTSAIVIHKRGEQFDFDGANVFYMFNPFGAATIRVILSKLQSSLVRYRREVRIVYVNPVHEVVFRDFHWLRQYRYWPGSRHLAMPHAVSFSRYQPGTRIMSDTDNPELRVSRHSPPYGLSSGRTS